ncbi:hypothetical protein MLD38_035445 [Melastoma candidum]|uniref:Uncharacterized protein n=1 Tax=Melastoma candidum TaxID=119954 RepID=A0ACB9LGX7_9MYRT|nr:hypothetical protein MLD38_035445 [Melastoma candidum]
MRVSEGAAALPEKEIRVRALDLPKTRASAGHGPMESLWVHPGTLWLAGEAKSRLSWGSYLRFAKGAETVSLRKVRNSAAGSGWVIAIEERPELIITVASCIGELGWAAALGRRCWVYSPPVSWSGGPWKERRRAWDLRTGRLSPVQDLERAAETPESGSAGLRVLRG